jgi:hypothetical protein
MMGDPTRLRAGSGGLEGRLLRSARSAEPPASAEDEVWRRVQAMTAASAVATGLAVSTAAGAKVAGHTLSLSGLSLLKWGAVIAVVALPAAGIATAIATRTTVHGAAALPVAMPQAVEVRLIASPEPTPIVPPVAQVVAPIASIASGEAPVRVHGGPAATPSPRERNDGPSALRKESASLASARMKLAAGDPHAALDEVGRLSVEFPRGRLVQEREVLAIACLGALGDGEGARTRALAFLARFPQSPYVDHVADVAHVTNAGGR